jgi:hypothetical protein
VTTVRSMAVRWRKSSYSSQGGDCIELDGNLRAVRDSKNPETVLAVDASVLVSMVGDGSFDL